MIIHTLNMCTSILCTFDKKNSHFLGLLNLNILSIRNANGVSDLCNLWLQQFSFLHIQT